VLIFPAMSQWTSVSPLVGLTEVALTVGFASLFLQAFVGGLKKAALVPAHDPYLAESLWRATEGLGAREASAHALPRRLLSR
jgi:hypothetical protein